MDSKELRQMFELEDTYWWFVGRRSIIRRMLALIQSDSPGRAVLDLGCGTGANLFIFSQFAKTVGMDPSPLALKLAETRRSGAHLVCGRAERIPFSDRTFDVVTCLDVLEHLADDCAALKEIRRVLKPDGALLATVPAYPWLWSEHDEALSHFRRYTKLSLIHVMRCAGYCPIKMSYVICAPLIPTAVLRLVQRMSRSRTRTSRTAHILLPPVLNGALISYLQCEASYLERANLPFGISLLVIARPLPAEEPADLTALAQSDNAQSVKPRAARTRRRVPAKKLPPPRKKRA